MAPINANDINDAKAFVPAKKVLPEVETDGANGNGNGNSTKGYVPTVVFTNIWFSVTAVQDVGPVIS